MIRRATPEDLPHLRGLATEFYHTTKFLKGFDFRRWCDTWGLLLRGGGAIFLAETSDLRHIGAIGGVAFPDINTGEITATEFFWLVDPAYRGCGVRLYQAFENWARIEGCTQIRMVALTDSMSEELDRFYKHKGFERQEVHYSKSLSG